MRGRAALMSMLLAGALFGAACSGGGGSSAKKTTTTTDPKVSPDWDKAGTDVALNAARKIAAKIPGVCPDLKLLDRVTYVSSSRKIGTPIPLAVGSCTALDEDIEISVFANTADRDKFVKARATVLCRRAAESTTALPGLRWDIGDNVSMQPDSEGVARRVASAISYRYELTGCPDQTPDWAAVDTAHVTALAGALHAANLGCADLQLQDRDLLKANDHYRTIGLPGAYAKCTIGKDANVSIASFRDTTTPFSEFLNAEQPFYCGQAKTTKIVAGTDWAVFIPQGANVDKIAKTLHGKPFGGSCPSP